MEVNVKKIKVLLAEQELTMREFCKKNNIPYSTFTGIMSGKRIPNLKTLGNIAKKLNTSIDEIIC